MKECKGQKIPANTEIFFVVDKSYTIKKTYPYDFKIKLGDSIEVKVNEYNRDICRLLKVTQIIKYKHEGITIHLSYPKVRETLKMQY